MHKNASVVKHWVVDTNRRVEFLRQDETWRPLTGVTLHDFEYALARFAYPIDSNWREMVVGNEYYNDAFGYFIFHGRVDAASFSIGQLHKAQWELDGAKPKCEMFGEMEYIPHLIPEGFRVLTAEEQFNKGDYFLKSWCGSTYWEKFTLGGSTIGNAIAIRKVNT
jgi:hypothetical protein